MAVCFCVVRWGEWAEAQKEGELGERGGGWGVGIGSGLVGGGG